MSRTIRQTHALKDLSAKLGELKFSVHPRVAHLVADEMNTYMREYNEAIDKIIFRIEVNDL